MEDPSEEWEIENENGSSSFEGEKKIEKSRVGWILDKSLSLGKKVVITGIVISSAPLLLPPLVVISAIGFAFSVPFGFVYASYACSERLMSKLLPETVPFLSLDDQKSLTGEEEQGGLGENASSVKGDFNVVAMEEEEREQEEGRIEEEAENPSLVKGGFDVVAIEEEEREQDEKLEEVENASLFKEDFELVAMEEEEREQEEKRIEEEEVENASLVKGDFDVVAMEEEEREQEEKRIEEVENASLVKGDFDVVAMEEEEREQEEKRIEEEVENASLVKGDFDVVAMEEEEREQEEKRIEEVENASLVKGDFDVVAMEEEEKEPVEEVQNESVVKQDVVALEKEVKEQEQDMKEGIEVRIELGEEGSRVNGNDDAMVREATNDDQEKVVSRYEILEQRGYGEDESLERMDDIEIEELDKERDEEPLLECNVQKPIVGDNEEDRKLEVENAESLEFIGDADSAREDEKNGVHCLKVQPVDYVENRKEDMSEDKNDDKNVAIREEEDASKTAELNKDDPEMKGREEREKAPPLECNEEPIKISDNKEDRKLEGQNTESFENIGYEGARDDAKNGVQPHAFVKNEDDKNILSRKPDDLPEDKNANIDKIVLATNVREKVKGDQAISMGKSSNFETEGKLDKDVPEVKGRKKVKGAQRIFKGKDSAVEMEGTVDDDVPEMKEGKKLKGGQTVSKGKRSAVETEGRGKMKNLKTQEILGNREGPESRRDEKHETSSGKLEKATRETADSYEKNDMNIVQDTKEKYEEVGDETNVEIIDEHNGKDGSNSVPNDITWLEKGNADNKNISLVSRKSTDMENELINGRNDILQGDNSKDGAGSVVYSNPGSGKKEENIISQEVSSNAEAEGARPISGLFALPDRKEAEANEPAVVILPDETKDSGDDVALSRVPELIHDVEKESKGNGNVYEADGAQSSDEGLLNEEKVWTQIEAVKSIIGYRERQSASIYEEVKALYLFTGVEPPSSLEDSSDVAEVYENLRFLMSVIGVK